MKFTKLVLNTLLCSLICQTASAQDLTRLGDELSTTITGHNGLQVVAPNVSDSEKRLDQLLGFITFHQKNSKRDGLGPRFNHISCGGCHIENGKGKVRIPRKNNRAHAMIVKVGLPGLNDDGSPIDVPRIGEQIQDKRVKTNKRRHKVRLRFSRVLGEYPDGTTYRLRTPKLTYRLRGFGRSETVFSLRMTPLLFGLGLLEAIKEDDVVALSDPADSDNDGISGRPNYVIDRLSLGMELGRFGFRASHPTVEQQTAAAAFFDMGITNKIFNDTEKENELPNEDLHKLTVYQALAGVPIARNQDDPVVIQGKNLFQDIGCNDCHVMEFTTEHPEHDELSGQVIHPFTDLLLHDMGDGLADERAEFSSSGREWRTTPLWGIGFAETVSKVKQRYLHDGRAKSLEEAILWHGGEAENSQNAFKNLSAEERDALITFLRSL